MLLIYTKKNTPRIVYIFKHICTTILGLDIKFTSKIEEFIAFDGAKLSYGKKRLGNELFIQHVDLLFEQGITNVNLKIQDWKSTKCFFAVSNASDLPFDIFASSFYILSRHEEYFPHVKDSYGRFPASESLAFKNGFLLQPVIDIWAFELKKILVEHFPTLKFRDRTYSSTTIFSVSHVYNFRNKGFIRSTFGLLSDTVKFKFSRVWDRLSVLINIKRDPYDVFDDLIEFIKTHKANMVFMFQLSDFNAYDRNINHNRLNYQSIIKFMADYAQVGLRLGYFALQDINILKVEKARFENIIHGALNNVLNSKYNLSFPENYDNLNELEIKNDYSMGFPATIGFRAGTCTPFLFYDINAEITTPLKIHPYILNSEIIDEEKSSEIQETITNIKRAIKKVNGEMKSIFSNRDFSEYANKNLYTSFLNQLHDVS